ncbi:copper resistance CopC family protein [Demequina capsici]|uniref:Copper resistance protein CopC n=1 Tax=Demequina capsici TaxID=3075620 RepID=A0AA96F8L1_9MICO|nr:copper resistance protein CopC [Demequina sp. OYTSA14]WNM25432.1 copper resistance protein CopC [Demequina sp. OYTSA14]
MRSRVLRPVLILLLALAAMLPASAASAHTSLVGTDPADGSTVSDLTQVSLEFTGEVLDLGTTLALVQGDQRIELDPTFPSATTVMAEVPALANGDWSLMYRVVAQDGHPLEGQVDFTVEGAAPSASASASPSTSPTASPTASASASEPTSGAASPSPSPSPSVTSEAPAGGGWARLGGVAVLLAAATVAILWLRRRGGDGPHGPASQD